jgi:hypothetical protein
MTNRDQFFFHPVDRFFSVFFHFQQIAPNCNQSIPSGHKMMPSTSDSTDDLLKSTTPASQAQRQAAYLGQRYQQLLDYTTPLLTGRWITTTLLMLAYIARVFIAKAWYIVTV